MSTFGNGYFDMKKGIFVLLLSVVLTATGYSAYAESPSTPTEKTDLLTVGLGWYDQTFFDPTYIQNRLTSPYFYWEYRVESPDIQLFSYTYTLKSWASIGVSVLEFDNLFYGIGEIRLDMPRSSFTPRLQTAFYRKDVFNQKAEFRSQLSLDYELSNEAFFSFAYSHISNSRFYNYQDTDMLSINYRFPINWFWDLD